MSSPLVSVVVPTHRRNPFLAETVASVRAQTITDWELLVVDDGWDSSDLLRQIVDVDSRTRVLANVGSGVSGARNTALAQSRGSWIVFLDHDDLLCPDHFEILIGALDDVPTAIGAYADYDVIDGTGRTTSSGFSAGPYDYDEMRRGGRRPSLVTTLASRSAAVSLGGFRAPMEPAEDLDYLYRLAGVGAFVHVPRRTASYRRHADNVSNDIVASAEAEARVLRAQRSAAEQQHDVAGVRLFAINAAAARSNAAMRAQHDATALLRMGQRKDALRLLRWSWSFAPRAALLEAARAVRRRGTPGRS